MCKIIVDKILLSSCKAFCLILVITPLHFLGQKDSKENSLNGVLSVQDRS